MKRNAKRLIALSLVGGIILSHINVTDNMALEYTTINETATTETTEFTEDLEPVAEYVTTIDDDTLDVESTTETESIDVDDSSNEDIVTEESSVEVTTEQTTEPVTSTEVSNTTEETTTEETVNESKHEANTTTNSLFIKMTEGGIVTVTIEDSNSVISSNIKLEDDKLNIDNDDITAELVKDDFYKIYTTNETAKIKVKTIADTDFKINFYSKKIDNGKWESIDFNDDLFNNTHKFTLDSNVYLNIGFNENINVDSLEKYVYNGTNYWFSNNTWTSYNSHSEKHNCGLNTYIKRCLKAGVNGSNKVTVYENTSKEETIEYNSTKIAKKVAQLKAADKEDSETITWETRGKITKGKLASDSVATIKITGNDWENWEFSNLYCCAKGGASPDETTYSTFDVVIKAKVSLKKEDNENKYSVDMKIYFLNDEPCKSDNDGNPILANGKPANYQNTRIKTSASRTEIAYGEICIGADKVINNTKVPSYDYNLANTSLTVTASSTIDGAVQTASKTFYFDEFGSGYFLNSDNEHTYYWDVKKLGGKKIPLNNTVTVSWTETYPNIMKQVGTSANGTANINTINATASEDANEDASNIDIVVTNEELFGSARMTKYYNIGSGISTDAANSNGIKYGLFVNDTEPIYEKLALTPTIATYNGIQLNKGVCVAIVDPGTVINNLPYGDYYFRELCVNNDANKITDSIWGNDYYLRDNNKYPITIDSTTPQEQSNSSSPETTPRGDFSFSKWANLYNKYQKPMADIPFLITYTYPNGTQESAVVLTDANGNFSSINAKYYPGLKTKGGSRENKITSADITGAKASGGNTLRFGTNYGVLSEGVVPIFRQHATITIDELWCDANINMENMVTSTITIGSDDVGNDDNGKYNITPINKTYKVKSNAWGNIPVPDTDAFRNDVKQAHITSEALSNATNSHILPISDITIGDDLGDGITRVTDTLSCTNLYANHNYLLKAKLVDKTKYSTNIVNFDDVSAFIDSSGNKLECSIEFNSANITNENDVYTIPMNYTINSTDVAGKIFVALVQLYDLTLASEYGETFLMDEEVNLDNQDQSLHSLSIETDAYDINSNNALIVTENATADEVANTITPKNAGLVITGENADFKDVKFSINDKITLHNFKVGEYYIVSEIREYTTDTLISKIGTEDNPSIKQIDQTDLLKGYIEINHHNIVIPKLDTRQGLRLYVTEKIYVKNTNGDFIKIAQHVDKEDLRQTIYFTGMDSVFDTSSHQSPVTVNGETTTLTDNVILRNLVLGETYTVFNYMQYNNDSDTSTYESNITDIINNLGVNNTSTNESEEIDYRMTTILTERNVVNINGNYVVKKVTFTVDEDILKKSLSKEGYIIPMTYTLDTSSLAGKSFTFGENLYIGNIEINSHHRLDDKNEQTRFPVIGTTAKDIQSLTQMVTVGETVIVDTVKIENLQASTKQKLKGILMDKATGEYLGKDLGLEPITGEVEWTTKEDDSERNMEVEVKFTIPNSLIYSGKQAVVFEELYTEGTLTVFHKDINDLGQTVTFVEASTTAYGDDDSKYIYPDNEIHTIKDVVHYKGLEIGKTYVQTGALWTVDENGAEIPLLIDNVQPVVSVEFTPTESEGDIILEFNIPTKYLSGAKIVVFEDTYYNGIKVATHADINDDNQTIYVPKTLQIAIAKADNDNIKYFLKGAEITIYKVGNEGEEDTIALDANGNECIATTDKDGLVKFSVYCKEGETFYAKETKAPNGYYISDEIYEVIPTENIDDTNRNIIKLNILDEAIVIPPVDPPMPTTSDTFKLILFVALTIIGTIGIIVTIKKRKRN